MKRKKEDRIQDLIDRHQKSKQVSEGSGLSIFESSIQINHWKCGEGDHDIDIIPYYAGRNDPDMKKGQFTYVLQVYVHRNVGGHEGQNFICLDRTYKKKCPICEHRVQLQRESADEELIKELRPGGYPRAIYNLVCYDTPTEEEKGVQVWETSYWLMQQHLLKLSESSHRDIEAGHPKYRAFADPDEGYSVRFNRMGERQNTRFVGLQLVQRNYAIADEILEQAHVLDEIIQIPTYEEVYKAYWDDDFGEEVADRSRTKKSTSRSSRREAPSRDTQRTRRPARRQEPPDVPEDIEDHGDIPSDSDDLVCPHGGEFAISNYELSECDECGLWEECYKANRGISGEDMEQSAEDDTPVEAPKRQSRRKPSNGGTKRGRKLGETKLVDRPPRSEKPTRRRTVR